MTAQAEAPHAALAAMAALRVHNSAARSARLAQGAGGASGRVNYFRPNNSGSLTIFAAIRRASLCDVRNKVWALGLRREPYVRLLLIIVGRFRSYRQHRKAR